jgi:ATP adenylyltransferase
MDCLACELNAHPDLVPGGRIATVGGWVVEHCVGPLGVGTVVVKPERHVTKFAALDVTQAVEIRPLMARVAGAVAEARADAGEPADQVYCCLWSHAERRPGHIHFVVQPISARLVERFNANGPDLQARMFELDERPDLEAAASAADQIRRHLLVALRAAPGQMMDE